MLSSIHPLGERGRNKRWGVTVTSFTIASTATGATIGAILGAAGSTMLRSASADVLLAATAIAALAAGALDLARVSPPGPERQVNETWIGHYREWVYGGAFGAQLGTGVVTYVVTWGVYAVLVAEFSSTSPIGGAVIGATFGLGRSLALILAGRIDRPSRLSSFHERMASLGPMLHRTTAAGASIIGTAGIIGSLGL